MIEKITAIHFSPTGNTKRIAFCIAQNLAGKTGNIDEIDMSIDEGEEHSFKKDDIVIFAVPVFGGRIPSYIADKLNLYAGNNAYAITTVVYGNRAYEDSLLELNDCVERQNFRVLASAALIAEHSIVHSVATGRPDEQDKNQIKEFAQKIADKLENEDFKPVSVSGNRPYVDWKPMPVVPTVSDLCNKCGECSDRCPTHAISKQNPHTTDSDRCILCMRCISICPKHARAIPVQTEQMLTQKLSPLQNIRHENEFFI